MFLFHTYYYKEEKKVQLGGMASWSNSTILKALILKQHFTYGSMDCWIWIDQQDFQESESVLMYLYHVCFHLC